MDAGALLKWIRCRMNRTDTITLDVKMQVPIYFQENLPGYTILNIRKQSCHPDDDYLYMVSAEKEDGTYTVRTCWNQSTMLAGMRCTRSGRVTAAPRGSLHMDYVWNVGMLWI